MCEKKELTQLLENLKKKKEIVIYGAGKIGKLFFQYLKIFELEKKVTAFAVSKTSEVLYCEGIQILDIDTVSNIYALRGEVSVVIAVNQSLTQELVEKCKKCNITHYHILTSEMQAYINSYIEKWQIEIDIFGSCISRDVFDYDTKNKFKIKINTSHNSIFSAVAPQVYHIDENEVGHSSQWLNRMIACDINKTALERLAQSKADWLLIDLMSERLDLAKIFADGKESLISWTDILDYTTIQKCFPEDKCDRKVMGYEQLEPEEVKKSIMLFCEKVKKIYGVNRICLIETRWVASYINQRGEICVFPENDMEKMNARLDSIWEKLVMNLNGCHIIKFPEDTIASEIHKWGLKPYHYIDDYYKYVYNEILRISTKEQKGI